MNQLGVEVDVGPLQTVELGPVLAAVEGDRAGQRVIGGERADQPLRLGRVGDPQPPGLVTGRQLVGLRGARRRVG